jgi:hypothetical protein
MRWTPKPPPPLPKEGDTREIREFAWHPVEMSDGQMVWLERYILVLLWQQGEWWCHETRVIPRRGER